MNEKTGKRRIYGYIESNKRCSSKEVHKMKKVLLEY